MNERLQELVAELRAAKTLDWRSLREQIHAEHERASSSEERAICLALYAATMDTVERQLADDELAKFRAARRQDYSLFVVRESLTGIDVDPAKLNAVTEREVAAGRMAPNHRLRVLAIFGSRGLAPFLDQHPDLYAALTAGSDDEP